MDALERKIKQRRRDKEFRRRIRESVNRNRKILDRLAKHD